MVGGDEDVREGQQAGKDIAFHAGKNILLSGNSVFSANEGLGKVYMRVDDSGSIIQRGNTGALAILGEPAFSKKVVGEVAVVNENEGGTLSALSPSVNEFPTLSRNRSKTVYRPTSAPVTARSGNVFSSWRDKRDPERAFEAVSVVDSEFKESELSSERCKFVGNKFEELEGNELPRLC